MQSGAPWEHTLDPAIVSRGPMPFRRYLFWFLSFLAIAYVAAFPLVRSKAYTEWGTNQWGPMLEFTYAPGERSADVLIFGDSSAFIGINPSLLEQELGVKALLLPNTIGSLPITADIPLQRYLATHTPPRLLVFYFSPWNLDYTHAKKVRFFEGEEMMLRHGSAGEIAGFVGHHPAEALFFPFRFYNTYGLGMLKAAIRHPHTSTSVQASLGHMDDRDPVPRLASTCTVPTKLFADQSSASLEELAQKYAQKLPELVYMAPVPGCTNVSAALDRSFSAVHAAPPAVLPAPDFVGDIYYAHIEPDFVPVASHLLAEAVKARLSQLPAPSPAGH